jgi:RND superfamily putative drug exporter
MDAKTALSDKAISPPGPRRGRPTGMSNALYRLGRWCVRRKFVVLGLWVAIAVGLIGLNGAVGEELSDGFEVPGVDSQEAVDLLSERFPSQSGLTAQVLFHANEGTLADPQTSAAVQEVISEIAALENVVAVANPTDAGSVSPDGTIALATVQYVELDRLSLIDLERIVEVVESANTETLQVETGGELVFQFDEPETGTGEMIGILAAVIILLLAFRSLLGMILPIALAGIGLGLGIGGLMGLMANFLEIPTWAPQMASMIGIGVGIDYALFIVTREREGLARGLTVQDSVGRAVATAGQAVIFAGGTVVIAILGLAIAGIPFMTAAAIATSTIVLLMVVLSVTFLPAMLGLVGHRINGLRESTRTAKVGAATNIGMWSRWGNHVANYAWPYLIGGVVFLLALAAPLLSLRLGFPDAGTVPDSLTQRRAYDLAAEGFGPGFNGPLVIAVDGADPVVVGELVAAINADPGIEVVTGPISSPEGNAAVINAIPNTSPQDSETSETIARLRAEVFPSVLDGSGITAHIGGGTASFDDVADRISARMPLFIGAVILLSFMLLTIVFRSILVPLKAALLNLLSIGAAYGVLVAVFQWGWGKGLIGLESTVPIVSFIPMFMFAILFGLSMDYEVFLLSRVKEEYLVSKDNTQSVIHGIANTARVITSAALIMISVFLGFVLGDDPIIKMMGLGLATAIFVDATIVRVVLVPASMKLMGKANWWFPKALEWLPRLDIEGEDGLPAPEFDPVTTTTTEPSRVPITA